MIDTLDLRGRALAQELFSELEKIARFKINNVDDLRKARKQVADMVRMVEAEPTHRTGKLTPMFSGIKGSRYRSLDKELKKMQSDLRDAEIELRDRGVGAMKRYSRDPTGFSKNPNEPDIKEVESIMAEINKNRTKKRGMIFKNPVKDPYKDIKKQAPPKQAPSAPKQGLLDRTAKAVGYTTMAGLGAAGAYKYNQNKKKNDMYGGGF